MTNLVFQKKGIQYVYGKRDLFGVVIAFRYLLPKESFLDFKSSLIKVLHTYSKQSSNYEKVMFYKKVSEKPIMREVCKMTNRNTSFSRSRKMITAVRNALQGQRKPFSSG